MVARFNPDYQFEALTSGKDVGAAKGAGEGALACGEVMRGRATGIAAGAMGLLYLVCLPVGATVGAIYGASQAASAAQVEEAKAAAQRGIAALKLQDEAVDAAMRYARDVGLQIGRLPQTTGPAKPDDFPSYTEAKGTADTIIEISVLSASASTRGDKDLRIELGMQARARVISTRDGKETDTLTIRAGSELRTIDEWLAADGRPIRAAFERGAALVAEHALDEILLVYHPKQMPVQTATGETERVPAYALRAIEPRIRNKVYWGGRMTWGHLERYPLDSLQPELRWEPWPRGFDIFPGSGPGQAREVRYDLRIFGDEGVAYERRGLAQAVHRLEQPLNPCRTYRWTVRARFILNDAPRATEWTGAYDTMGGAVAPWWFRRGSGAPALAKIGSQLWYYPIIETPGMTGGACPGR